MQLLRAGVQNKNFTDSSVLCAQRSGSNVFPQSSQASAGLLLHKFARKNEIGQNKSLLNSTFGYVLQRQEMQQEMA